jgi:hypothetical protein
MRAFISALSTPKLGSLDEECEDAFSVSPQVSSDELIEGVPVLVSVADGASESLLSRHWAKTLTTTMVKASAENPDAVRQGQTFADTVLDAIDEWDGWLEKYLAKREELLNPIRWYEEPGLERGSHSAVLTAYFAHSLGETGDWYASALGDVCLFQVRDDNLLYSFPLAHSSDFNNAPALLNSKNRDVEIISLRVEVASGSYAVGDQFFVGTDALAAWFFARFEEGGRPWETLRDVTRSGDAQEFSAWVQDERSSGRMRNDDVTVVNVDLG